jgi:hypothetical protein
MGGTYVGSVKVELKPSERSTWIKYTTDGSDPSDENGNEYSGAITLEKTTILKFRAKDMQGNLEPVKTVTFKIAQPFKEAVFDNHAEKDGYVKANADGSKAFVGTFHNLAIGTDADNKDNRAILHFDTATIPDNATITKAYIETTLHSKMGDVFAGGRRVQMDVHTGYFGSSQAVQTGDWGATATAEEVAYIDQFSTGKQRSTDFSKAGLEAINKTGVTQIRLRVTPAQPSPNNYVFIKGGASAKLFVEYSV